MNGYKDINRALTLQNQEYRQEVARLKKEIILLNQQIMSGNENLQQCKFRFARFVQQVVVLCNEEFNLLNIVSGEDDQYSVKKDISKRSVPTMRTSLREISLNVAANDKENISPAKVGTINEDTRNISYVQTRRRQQIESGDENDEESQPELDVAESTQLEAELESDNEDDSEVDLTRSDEEVDESLVPAQEDEEMAEQDDLEEDPDQLNLDIPTIREENTADFTNAGSTVRSLSQTNLSIASTIDSQNSSVISNPQRTLLPQIKNRTQSKSNLLSIPDISLSVADSSIHSPAITLNRRRLPEEDTIFENFKDLQAASSTPFKQKKIIVRNAVVRLKRLGTQDLKQFGIRPDETSSENQKSAPADQKDTTSKSDGNKRSNRRKNLSPKWSSRLSDSRKSNTFRASVEGINGTTSSSSTFLSRPRRNAAPSSLKEPSTRRKMRRS